MKKKITAVIIHMSPIPDPNPQSKSVGKVGKPKPYSPMKYEGADARCNARGAKCGWVVWCGAGIYVGIYSIDFAHRGTEEKEGTRETV